MYSKFLLLDGKNGVVVPKKKKTQLTQEYERQRMYANAYVTKESAAHGGGLQLLCSHVTIQESTPKYHGFSENSVK